MTYDTPPENSYSPLQADGVSTEFSALRAPATCRSSRSSSPKQLISSMIFVSKPNKLRGIRLAQNKFGDVVVCLFPFSDGSQSKKRPAVVISPLDFNQRKEDLIILAITSKVEKLLPFEAKLEDWDDAGLFKESAFKSSIFTISKNKIHMKLGLTSKRDKIRLIKMINSIVTTND